MFENQSIMAMIVARGGSKGLPGKNIKPLAGKPLISWTIDAAIASRYLDRVILSSDDDFITDTARRFGCEVPFVRPPELAVDSTTTDAVVLHALQWMDQAGTPYDWVMMLQPTSPFRTTADIDACIEACIVSGKTSMVSVTEAKGTYWTFTLDAGYSLAPILPGGIGRRRQDLPATYTLNGALYLARVDVFRARGTFIGPDTGAYVMSAEASVDIDTPLELDIAELIAKRLLKGETA
jgi:CMP-N,N'-diacetyllegionaminic acid synthase